jgi:hypothetical protein
VVACSWHFVDLWVKVLKMLALPDSGAFPDPPAPCHCLIGAKFAYPGCSPCKTAWSKNSRVLGKYERTKINARQVYPFPFSSSSSCCNLRPKSCTVTAPKGTSLGTKLQSYRYLLWTYCKYLKHVYIGVTSASIVVCRACQLATCSEEFPMDDSGAYLGTVSQDAGPASRPRDGRSACRCFRENRSWRYSI